MSLAAEAAPLRKTAAFFRRRLRMGERVSEQKSKADRPARFGGNYAGDGRDDLEPPALPESDLRRLVGCAAGNFERGGRFGLNEKWLTEVAIRLAGLPRRQRERDELRFRR